MRKVISVLTRVGLLYLLKKLRLYFALNVLHQRRRLIYLTKQLHYEHPLLYLFFNINLCISKHEYQMFRYVSGAYDLVTTISGQVRNRVRDADAHAKGLVTLSVCDFDCDVAIRWRQCILMVHNAQNDQ